MTDIIYENKKQAADKDDWDAVFEKMCRELDEKQQTAPKLNENVYAAFRHITETAMSGKRNNVFSPAAFYLALILLSEITDGNTRKQIIDAIRADDDDTEEIYQAVKRLTESENGIAVSSIASSIWLNSGMDYKKEFLRSVGKKFGSSVYSGEMGTEEINSQIGNWINENTNGILKNDIDVKTTPDTLLEMLTTIYFCTKWDHEFEEEDTKSGLFTTEGDGRVECEFMHQDTTAFYHDGKNFRAVSKELSSGYYTVFILPRRRKTVDELFSDPQVQELATTGRISDSEECYVKLAVPRYDITSKINLIDIMEKLGIKDVFDSSQADFSPASSAQNLFLSKAEQTTRFIVNEEGVEAASCVEMGVVAAGMPPELKKVRLTFDSPFIFMIISCNRIPVFAGKVVNPSER